MHDLVEFLRARLLEDDDTARWAADHRSRPHPGPDDSGRERWHWIDLSTGERLRLGQRPMDHIEREVSLRSVNTYLLRSRPGAGPHYVLDVSWVKEGVALHIARHDPARVVAEVEVKRRLLDLHTRSNGTGVCQACGESVREGGCTTLRLLAMPYADHPAYRKTWKV
ncbi:DUF6221 family protein [Actinomadura rubrisoli]|uniref:Uncharacterized protein n=1 Tax=Actinomadura rubrisoli TaxID=2530368 RepID=A0A4R5B5U3_9ACTN|nr:DUF6221 family protein [Actinomadura rubrisoli]TDD79004.1 hypothetical protein E1298_28880 [Actinomadura rubrisoli]